MKILYLFSSAETSVAIVTLNQIKALRKYYPELVIKIACVNYYPERSVLEGEIDYKKDFNPNQIINYIQSLLFVKKVKKDFNPDVTISNMSTVNSFNSLIGGKDVKIGIFHAPNIQFKNKSIITKFWHMFSIKFLFNRLNYIVGISQEIVDDFRKYYLNEKVLLFYNLHNFEKIKNLSLIDKEKNCKPKLKIELLMLGTIDRNKRQDLVINFLKSTHLKNIKLFIVGSVIDNTYFLELQKIISDNELSSKIEFISFSDNPYALIKKVDILLSMSETEGLPGVLIESLILDTPIISTNSSKGVWEINNCINNYQKNLKDIFICDKGVIIPNPNQYDDLEMIKFIEKALLVVEENKKIFVNNIFVFQEEIEDNSIHAFYQFLKGTLYEINN